VARGDAPYEAVGDLRRQHAPALRQVAAAGQLGGAPLAAHARDSDGAQLDGRQQSQLRGRERRTAPDPAFDSGRIRAGNKWMDVWRSAQCADPRCTRGSWWRWAFVCVSRTGAQHWQARQPACQLWEPTLLLCSWGRRKCAGWGGRAAGQQDGAAQPPGLLPSFRQSKIPNRCYRRGSRPLGYRHLDDAAPAREGTREVKRSESPPSPSPSGLMIKWIMGITWSGSPRISHIGHFGRSMGMGRFQ
jgi:hypothetical protein